MRTRLREYSPLDRLLMRFDEILRGPERPLAARIRPNPADSVGSCPLGEAEIRQSARLMRVNHAGEVSAQALYQGQALTAVTPRVREIILHSASEEIDHLYWCQQRLHELGSHTSYLNPVWYAGSFSLGVLAGCMGDEWSLGFIAETEAQVMRHLDSHLQRLPEADSRSRAILEQMKREEGQHASVATGAGGRSLPGPVKKIMGFCSRVMTRTAYWI